MTPEDIADTLIFRLNALLKDVGVRDDVRNLIETRIPVGKATSKHPSIQVNPSEEKGKPDVLGFLGLLNGVIGTIPAGKYKGWGYITAVFDDDEKLVRFRRTDKPE